MAFNTFHWPNEYDVYYPGFYDHENLPYGNPWNAINPVVDFQPQQTEMKPSLEDLINVFVIESRASCSRNETRLNSIETHMGNMNTSIRSLETQSDQLANSVYNPNKGVCPSYTDFLEDLEDCVANDETDQYPLEHCNENSISQDIVDTGEVMEHVLALEEKVSNKVKPLEEESSVEEVRANLELKQLPKSLRYAIFGTDSFFPMISSSSFTGVEEEKPLQVQNYAGKEMKLHNENINCFKIDRVEEIIEEFLGKPIDNTEAIEYENQLGAPEKVPKPIRRFKEPVHRKAKFPFME